jgi:hypothetical protein
MKSIDLPDFDRINGKVMEIGALIEKAKAKKRAKTRHMQTQRKKFAALMADCATLNPTLAVHIIANTSKSARALIDKVNARPVDDPQYSKVHVQILPASDPRIPPGSRAACDPSKKRVYLREGLSLKECVALFLFEICNIIRGPEFDAVEDHFCVDTATEADAIPLGKACETVEYGSVVEFSTTMQKCIAEDGWDPDMDHHYSKLQGKWKTVDGYIAVQERTGHTNAYRKQFLTWLREQRSTPATGARDRS